MKLKWYFSIQVHFEKKKNAPYLIIFYIKSIWLDIALRIVYIEN